MKILIVHPSKGFYGGAEEVGVQLAHYLKANGHECILLTTNPPKDLLDRIENKVVSKSYKNMWWAAHRCLELDWADVINVHNFPATLITFPTRKPIIWMCNEPPELFTNWKRKPIEAFNRWWVRKSGMGVVVADQEQYFRFMSIYGIDPTVIPYGVNYNFWSQGTRTKREGPIKLLQVGTVTPYKNQIKSLCEFNSLLLEYKLDITLTFAGNIEIDKQYYEDLLDSIEILAEENPGIEERITFLGQQTPEQIRTLYYNHDILLHPVKDQGGWLVPFEAMCAGLPVLVSPEFTGTDIIVRNKLGTITDDMAKVVLNKGYEIFDTERSKEWVKENLTWEKYGEGMVKVFKEAINE